MKRFNLILIGLLTLFLLGCPKQLVRIDEIPINISTGAVHVDIEPKLIEISKSTFTIEIAKDIEVGVIKDIEVGVIKDVGVIRVSSGAAILSGNEINTEIEITPGAIKAFFENVKPWQFILLLIAIIIAAVLEEKVRRKKR